MLRAARKAAGEACSLESIALMVHGQAGVLDLTRSLKIDADTATTPPVARFWRGLAALVRPGGRIDLVSCSIASGVQGAQLLAAIRACTGGVQVAASCHVLSNSTTLVLETAGVDVKTTYFEPEALEQWTGTCMMFSAGADEDGDGGYKDVEGEKAKKKRLANRHWVRKLAKLQHTILENCFEAWQSEYLAERSNCYRATRYTEVLHQWQVDHEMARSMQAKMLEETKEQDSRMQVASDYLLMLAYTRQTQKRAFAMWVQEHRENKRRQHLLERIRYRWSSESRPPTAEEEEAWIAGTTLKPELPYEERLAQWVGQGVTRTFFRMVLRGWLSAARAEAKQRTASRLKTLEAQVAALLENQEKANAEERLMQLEQRTGSLHEHTDRLQEQLVGHQTQVQDRDSQEKLMRVTRMIQSKGWFRQSSLLRDILLNWYGFAFEQKRMVHLLDRTLFRMQTLQLQRAFSPWARKTREKLADKNQQVLSALHEGLQNTITTMDHLAGGEGGLSSMMDFKQAMLGESKVGRKDIEELSRKFKELDFMLEEQHKDQSAKWVAIRAKEEEAKRLKIERVCVKRMEQNNLQRQARCFDAWVYSAWESRRHQYQVKRFVARYQHRELADIFYTWCLHTQAVRRAAFRLEKGLERHYLAVLSLTFKAWSNNTKSKSNQQALVMRAALSGLAKNVDTLHFRVEQAADLDTMAKLNEEIIIQSELRESSEAQVKGVFKTMVEDRIAEENRKRNVTIERWTTRQLTRTELQAKAETFASWYDCARVSRVHEKRIKRMLQRIRNSLAARAFSAWVGHTQVAPVLLIVSSRMRQHHLLANSVHRDAAVVSYDWETTTLEDLVAEARAAIHPCARAQNISMMVTGKPGCVSVVKGRRTTEQSLNDVDVELFWTQLGDMVVKNGRIDLLARPAPFASRSVRRARLTPQVNPGSRYRCCKRDFKSRLWATAGAKGPNIHPKTIHRRPAAPRARHRASSSSASWRWWRTGPSPPRSTRLRSPAASTCGRATAWSCSPRACMRSAPS